MTEVTRAVSLDDLRDLVASPPRAYLACSAAGAPEAVRVACRHDAGRWLITLPPAASVPDRAPAVLLIDDGETYLELRGIRVRGTLLAPVSGTRELIPEKIVCWDYGAMRRRTP